MIELLALGSAVFYGSADFYGGLTARRANTIATVVVTQFVGLVLLLAGAAISAGGRGFAARLALGDWRGLEWRHRCRLALSRAGRRARWQWSLP